MAATGPPPQRKLTKAERKKADAELKRRMPSLAAVSRNGVFETVGQLYSTNAVGQIPGGRFIPTRMVAKGHNLYLFDGASPPSAKPRSFLNVKRAEVVEVGLLLNPPLPPHTNVMRINLLAKQFGHKSSTSDAGMCGAAAPAPGGVVLAGWTPATVERASLR